jgi:hypothetical protein
VSNEEPSTEDGGDQQKEPSDDSLRILRFKVTDVVAVLGLGLAVGNTIYLVWAA